VTVDELDIKLADTKAMNLRPKTFKKPRDLKRHLQKVLNNANPLNDRDGLALTMYRLWRIATKDDRGLRLEDLEFYNLIDPTIPTQYGKDGTAARAQVTSHRKLNRLRNLVRKGQKLAEKVIRVGPQKRPSSGQETPIH